MEGIGGDFGSMDMSSYNDAMDQFQSSLNSGLASVADSNKTAQEKVQEFNQAIQGSFQAVSAPILAKGVGKTFGNIKSALSKRYGQAVDDAKQALQDKAEQAVEGAKKEVGDLVNKVTNKITGQTAPENPAQSDLADSNIDSQISANEQVFNNPAFDPNALDEAETNIDDAISGAGDSLDNLAPGFRVLADVNRPPGAQPGEPSTNPSADVANDANAGDASVESGTDGLSSVATDSAEATSDAVTSATSAGATTAETTAGVVEATTDAGLATTEATVGATAAAEGGLNPIADLAALGLGLGMLFTGLFAKKHAHTEAPPPPANPTFSFGT